jgi:hypothetical protein
MLTQSQLNNDYDQESIDFNPADGYPAGPNLYYKCLQCGILVPSYPAENIGCECRNIFIDVESGRISIKKNEGIRLIRITPKMNSKQSIPVLLEEAERLLHLGNEDNWARSLRNLREEYGAAPESTRGQILALFGGAGSFSDVVLYSTEGSVLIAENTELSRLRTAIHAACRAR